MAEEQQKKGTGPKVKVGPLKRAPQAIISPKPQTPLEQLKLDCDVLSMLYPKEQNGYFLASISPADEIAVYKALKEKTDKKKKLLILLDTSGGNVYSAVKIMDTLRTQYTKITIAIPQKAKSSGTMMCCGAEKLIMSSISELGPLDKPMLHPDDETAQISALDIIKSIDEMIDTAIRKEKKLALEITEEMGIPIKASLGVASELVSRLITPMLCREDAKIYNQAKRLLAIAERYCSELLENYMLKSIQKDKLRHEVAELITRRLVWLYPDHGFAIRRNELKDMLFTIEAAEDCDFWDELWREYRNNIGKKQKSIKFI